VASEIVKEIILCESSYPDNFLAICACSDKAGGLPQNAEHTSLAAAIKVVPFRGIKEQSAKSWLGDERIEEK
jgi:hypothetical protein